MAREGIARLRSRQEDGGSPSGEPLAFAAKARRAMAREGIARLKLLQRHVFHTVRLQPVARGDHDVADAVVPVATDAH